MKRTLTTLFSLLFIGLTLFAGKGEDIPQVILIGIGDKNTTFNEAQYPHLKFYYTPELAYENQTGDGSKGAAVLGSIVDKILVGTPGFFTKINDDHNILECYFLFDKSGVCYTQGYKINRRDDLKKATGPDDKSLEDAFKETVKKEKVAKLNKKEMKMKKSEFMIGHKMPDCKVTDATGSEIGIKTITESGEPVLVLFFYLDSDIDIQAAKESGAGKSGGSFAKDMSSGVKGSTLTSFCENIESQFFGYDAREK